MTEAVLNPEESLVNQWRSFLRYFSENWDTTSWPSDDFPVFPYRTMLESDRARITRARGYIVLMYDSFVGGRGYNEDNIYLIRACVKHEENLYDSLILNLADSIISVYEGAVVSLYDFRGSKVDNPVKVDPEEITFPIYTTAEVNEEAADEDFMCLDIVFNVAGLRPSRKVDLRG